MQQPFPTLSLHFSGELRALVRTTKAKRGPVTYGLSRRASIKDIIEALGVPHTEVGAILRENGAELPFSYIPDGQGSLTILPQSTDVGVTQATVLRPQPLSDILFMVDINVGKLARLLRMAGIDASDVPRKRPTAIARIAADEGRILLSRNRELLRHKEVVFGRLVRAEIPWRQFEEVVGLYSLVPRFALFSRCLLCNSLLETVAKEDVLDQLLPLTIKYYSYFRQCSSCSRIYWRGSHHEAMLRAIKHMTNPHFS